MDANEHYTKAKERCEALWPKSMFTPLVMLEWLLSRSGRSIQDFIEQPSFSNERDRLIESIGLAGEEELRPLWAGNTGVCTSWALQVTTSLDGEYIYGTKNNHRAAWMANGVVVDSSARYALLLKANEVEIAQGTRWRMKNIGTMDAILSSGKEKMEDFSKLPDHLAAMRCCLVQVVDKTRDPTFFSLYRSVGEAGELRFNGALVWQVACGSSIISVSQREVSDEGRPVAETVRAVFAAQKPHSEQNQDMLKAKFRLFDNDSRRHGQFQLVRHIIMEILAASEMIYGAPVYELITE